MLEPIWLHTIFRDVGYRHVSKSICMGVWATGGVLKKQ